MTRLCTTGILTSLILAIAVAAPGEEAPNPSNKNKTDATTTATPYTAKKNFDKEVKATTKGGATTPSGWLDDFSLAKDLAKKYSRTVLVLITESEANEASTKLWTEVLNKREFKKFAGTELVLLYVDNTKTKLSEAQATKNATVVKELAPASTAPSTILVSPDGKTIGSISGFQTNYTGLVKGFVEKK